MLLKCCLMSVIQAMDLSNVLLMLAYYRTVKTMARVESHSQINMALPVFIVCGLSNA